MFATVAQARALDDPHGGYLRLRRRELHLAVHRPDAGICLPSGNLEDVVGATVQ